MKTHIFLVSSDRNTVEMRLIPHLQSFEEIKNVKLKSLRDKTILKIKTEASTRGGNIKKMIYSKGIYARKLKGFYYKLRTLTM